MTDDLRAKFDRLRAAADNKDFASKQDNAKAPTGAEAEIERLAKLPPVEYARQRKAAAKKLNVRVDFLDAEIKARRKNQSAAGGNQFLEHWKVAPWPSPVDGGELLKDLVAHLERFVVLPNKAAAVAIALWVLHTWVFECFDITPYLAITSPTRRCGKTVLMTMLYWLCCRGKKNDTMSKAAIYRSVEGERPTLVMDEVSWVLDTKDERQNILCGGFERNGYAEICEEVGGNYVPRRFSTFCPKAFGLIGKLTAVLMDRSIEISLRRKTTEEAKRLRRRDNDDHANLRRRCLRWAQDNTATLAAAAPALPSDLNDRALDIWEPLFAIAERVGGDWPKRARDAATVLSGGDAASEERGVELLADIKAAFASREKDALTTKTLIAELCADEERPWATWNKGKPISDRQVAKLLKPFVIISENVQTSETGEDQAKGYRLARFEDAFARYLGTPYPHMPLGGGPEASNRPNVDETGTTDDFSERPENNLDGNETREKPTNHGHSDTWTDADPHLDDEAYIDAALGVPRDDDDPNWLTVSTGKSDLEAAYDELRWRAANERLGGITSRLGSSS
jgi:putative DNA primase/helicase